MFRIVFDRQPRDAREKEDMSKLLQFFVVVFAVTLAVMVGKRMSADAMAIVIGVICGVLASIPTSLLVVWATGRRGAASNAPDRTTQAALPPGYPPVVVINPGQPFAAHGYGRDSLSAPDGYPYANQLPPAAGPRTFKVVGDEDTT